MSCGFPIEVGGRYRPCGKCQGCLRRRRKAWVGRMLLEQLLHHETTFLTLTYADQHLPLVYHEETDIWIPTLAKSQLQTFLKSASRKLLRAGFPKLRYFASGEYGDKTLRPHYHAIMFGVGVGWTEALRKVWGRGHVSLYPATSATMAYVAKYCLKGSKDAEPVGKMFNEALEQRLTQEPFRLMSKRPALGVKCKTQIIRSMCGVPAEALATNHVTTVRIGKNKYPLDRTMRDKLETEFHENYNVPNELGAAIFKRDDYEPTDEEVYQGYQNHLKALRFRGARTKL